MKWPCVLFLLLIGATVHAQSVAAFQDKHEKVTTQQKPDVLYGLYEAALYENLDQALRYAKQGFRLARQNGDRRNQTKFAQALGKLFLYTFPLDSAAHYMDVAIKGYSQHGDPKAAAHAQLFSAQVDFRRGQTDKGIETALTSLRTMERLKDPNGTCEALVKVAYGLTMRKRINEAWVYQRRAQASYDANPREDLRYWLNLTTGYLLVEESRYADALRHFNHALDAAQKQNLDPIAMGSVLNWRGNAYKRLGRYREALADYQRVYDFSSQIGLSIGVTVAVANLGETNMLLGRYAQALPYQLETVRLQEASGDNSNLLENYGHLSRIYEKLGDLKTANAYLKKASAQKDTVAAVEREQILSDALVKYQTEQKEATIRSQQVQLVNQQRIQWLGASIGMMLIGFLAFGYFTYRSRTKANRLLAAKNQENELLLKEIHHRVKNNLEIVSSLLALQSAQIDDPNTKEAMAESQNRVNSIGIVHQKLYQGMSLGSIEMKDYLLNLGESIFDSLGAYDHIELQLLMEPLYLDIDTAVPLGLIINELLTNAVKYAFPNDTKGTVTITLQQASDSLHLEVADNGIGKSGIIKGTGFGSQLIALLTHQLNGTMQEKIQDGTVVTFVFKRKSSRV